MAHTLTENAEFIPLAVDGSNFVLTTGTSDVNSTIVDTLGYESIVFIVAVGAISSSGSVTTKIQHDTDSAGGTMADLLGSAQTVSADTDDNKLFIHEVWHPQKRYLRVVTTRGDGGNSTINAAIAIGWRTNQAAVTQPSGVYAIKKLLSPVAGTA